MRRLCLKHRHLERMILKLNALEMLELAGTEYISLAFVRPSKVLE